MYEQVMNQDQGKPDVNSIARWLFTALLIWAGVQVLGYLSDVLIPFVIAFLLAYLINPIVSWAQKRLKNRTLAVLSTLIVLGGTGTFVLYLIVPTIIQELNHITALLAKLVQDTDFQARARQQIPDELWLDFKV
ncbi:MAG: AI-2E family transporter [Desulfonatronovibrionaceae bacterium]